MCRGHVRRMLVLGLGFRPNLGHAVVEFLLIFVNFEPLTFRFYRRKLTLISE